MRRFWVVVVCLSAASAQAQDADAGLVEPVDAGAPAAPVVASPLPVAVAPLPAPAPVPLTAAARMKGHLGFGFLGTAPVLQASEDLTMSSFGGSAPAPFVRVSVPILGLRWWTPVTRLGLEFGLGAMVSAPSSELPVANGSDIETGPTTTELLFQFSAPIMLASTEHTIVFIAPELRMGRSTKTTGDLKDVLLSMTWDACLKAGVEIFFSFIGLPNLSLEAGVRAGFTHEVRTFTSTAPLNGPAREGRRSLSRFSTSLVANPWDLFTSTLSARYYF